MMSRRCCCGAMALLMSFGLLVQRADAQPFGMSSSPRALCVTDPYGTPFHSWYGSPVAYNSYFYMPFAGAYTSSGYSGTSSGFFWGGVPAVASATTPEWIVQRTSVFPIGNYNPWSAYPRPLSAPWSSGIGPKNSSEISNDKSRRQRDSEPLQDFPIRQVSGELPSPGETDPSVFAEGDRLLREGEPGQAYLRYLRDQRDEGDRGEVYFRQAFALVAMGRYSHAVAKLKRGVQVDPEIPIRAANFEEAFGTENTEQSAEILNRAQRWMNEAPRDPDRLFLLGALLHFEKDSKSSEFIEAAWNLTDHRQHLKAFR